MRRRVWLVAVLALALCVAHPAGQPASPAPTLRVYLARHGETDWNVELRTQGGTDTPLNATGRQQALALKQTLKNVHLDEVYSSALSRSRDTANVVRGQAPLTSLPGLNERRYGKFEGLLQNDPVTGPEFLRRRWEPDDALEGGESLTAFVSRVKSALDTIRTRHASGNILIVGHLGTNQAILRLLLGLSVEQMRAVNQSNDELYLLELEGRNTPRLWKLITEANLKDL